jgi:isoleucyl-tRNA synthetase
MSIMASGLTRLLAPILPVTADQLWASLPGAKDASVHLAMFPRLDELAAFSDSALVEKWDRLIALRDRVLAAIEPLRKSKQIGSPLQAKVVISAPQADYAGLESYLKDLPMLFIVSDVDLRRAPGGTEEIAIERAGGVKCERCWRYVPSVSKDPAWAGLCDRCQEALAQTIHG